MRLDDRALRTWSGDSTASLGQPALGAGGPTVSCLCGGRGLVFHLWLAGWSREDQYGGE